MCAKTTSPTPQTPDLLTPSCFLRGGVAQLTSSEWLLKPTGPSPDASLTLPTTRKSEFDVELLRMEWSCHTTVVCEEVGGHYMACLEHACGSYIVQEA